MTVLIPSLSTGTLMAGELSGFVGAELRLFPGSAPAPRADYTANGSVAVQPEYRHEWDDGHQSFALVPFYRWDQHDEERTHFDLRELAWVYAADTWELRAGVSKVFWGVTEAAHLVDIINQTDLVEDVDGEEKLGQPMLNLALIRSWGTVDLFLLPRFRERTFPGADGRPQFPARVDSDLAQFESAAEEWHVDGAIRWSNVIGSWDIGLTHFYGTSRDPSLSAGLDEGSNPVLIPRYDIIHQTSLDLQGTTGNWLWKLEALGRSGQESTFFAGTGGFEYTFVGVFDTAVNLGLIGEYVYDDRPENVPTVFDDDIIGGFRITFNDPQSAEVLISTVFDVRSSAKIVNVEASRRIGENWKFGLEARFFEAFSREEDPFFAVLNDDGYIQLTLSRFF